MLKQGDGAPGLGIQPIKFRQAEAGVTGVCGVTQGNAVVYALLRLRLLTLSNCYSCYGLGNAAPAGDDWASVSIGYEAGSSQNFACALNKNGLVDCFSVRCL